MAVSNAPIGERLTANLLAVQQGKAYGVDEQGQLLGEALKASFKGKLVEALVDKGIARQGNLGGRIAVALVGREQFELIAGARNRDNIKSSIANTIAAFEAQHTRGADSDIAALVRERIQSGLSEGASLGTLVSGRIQDVETSILQDVIPKRLAYRQEILNQVLDRQPTPAMQKADQAALLMARHCVQEGVSFGTPEFYDRLGEASSMVTGGRERFANQTMAIMRELPLAVLQVNQMDRAGGSDAAQGEEVTNRFVQALDQRIAAVDKDDGMHVRLDGQVSAPGKDRASVKGGGVEGAAPRKQESRSIFAKLFASKPAAPKEKSVRFAGGEITQEFKVGNEARTQRAAAGALERAGGAAPRDFRECCGSVEAGLYLASMAMDRTGVDPRELADLPEGMGPEILDANTSHYDVLKVLTSGETGIRPGIDALLAIRDELRPHELPSATLNGGNAAWAQQTDFIQQLADRIASAGFSKEVPGAFADYGNTQNNPFSVVVQRFPEVNLQVRNWLDDGISLTSALHDAQSRPERGEPPLKRDELRQLAVRVDEFARSTGRGQVQGDFSARSLSSGDSLGMRV